jgi:hypothetical protein
MRKNLAALFPDYLYLAKAQETPSVCKLSYTHPPFFYNNFQAPLSRGLRNQLANDLYMLSKDAGQLLKCIEAFPEYPEEVFKDLLSRFTSKLEVLLSYFPLDDTEFKHVQEWTVYGTDGSMIYDRTDELREWLEALLARVKNYYTVGECQLRNTKGT